MRRWAFAVTAASVSETADGWAATRDDIRAAGEASLYPTEGCQVTTGNGRRPMQGTVTGAAAGSEGAPADDAALIARADRKTGVERKAR
jgi:hypothetical protein